MMRRVVSLAVICTLSGWPALAESWRRDAVAMPGDSSGQKCAMQEAGQVGVSFNNVVITNLEQVGPEMDRRIDEIIALARKSGIEKIEVQSYNYNVNPVSTGYPPAPGATIPYQYNSSVSFSIAPCEKASAMMSLLAGKGYVANLNVNAYRQCQ